MGYFNSSIVFTSQPSWPSLNVLPAQIGLRGYRHDDATLWLLDFWIGSDPPTYPFTEGREAKVFATFDADSTSDRLQQLDSHFDDPYGWKWLRFALQVSRLTEQDVFLFAADDELYDFGATVSSGEIKRLAARVEMCNIVAYDGSFTITPMIDAEDDPDMLDELSNELRSLPFVSVSDPVELTGGLPLYGNVIAEWPEAAGDPESLLGLGTWDPFANVDEKLTLEFERLAERKQLRSASHVPQNRPWWRFW